ncbi:MAG: barstar family protein [Paludibacter sp.]|nr:barstar family protein [Paludibacter sp.]
MENIQSIEIDFKNIQTNDDFYRQLKLKIELPDYFGNNLDALYDVLTGYIKLPLKLNIINLKISQLKNLSDLFSTFDDAENATDYDFMYSCSLENEAVILNK